MRSEDNKSFFYCHTTAAFTGQAFAGKLKKVGYYLKSEQEQAKQAPAITEEQMRALDEKFAQAKGGG